MAKAELARKLALLTAPLALLIAPGLAAQTGGAAPAADAGSPSPAVSPAAAAWGHTASDIAPDANVRWGVLANGMKYAILANATPKGTASVRLSIDVGSFAEAEDQRGLAHFLEHMAFNGSTNVPEGEMVKLLERKGLAFGADTNASTGLDNTNYRLDLPQASDDLIDTALMLMRETASELTITAAAVDRERGVIVAEEQVRNTFQFRNAVDNLTFTYPDTTAWQRLPIGLMEVVKNAPRERIIDLYQRYYRPERATLVVVGDVDPADIAARIAARFGDWTGRGPAGPDPDIGTVDPRRPAAASVYVDPALGEAVSFTRHRPFVARPDTAANRRQAMIDGLGVDIVNRRLAKLALAEDSPMLGGGMGYSRNLDIADSVSLSANAKDGQWQAALALIDREWRAAAAHGFTEAELAEAVANRRQGYADAVAAAATRRNTSLASGLLAVADGKSVFARPEVNRDLFETVATGLTAAAVSAAFAARQAEFGPPLIRVTAKTEVPGGSEAVLAAWRAASQTATTPPVAAAAATFAYTDFGTPGQVVSDERVADLNIRRIRFNNGVMLNIKRTDFQDDTVLVNVRVDGGSQLAPDDPLRFALGGALSLGGLGKHSVDDLRTVLAGRSVAAGWTMGLDNFGTTARTTPRDLPLQAQVLAAYVADPGWRADGLALLRAALPRIYAANDATPNAVMGRDVEAILANDNPRFATPPLDKMLALDWDGLRDASRDAYANGAVEIGVVGAVDEDAAIAAIAATFGALPQRRPDFVVNPASRVVAFAADRSLRTLIHKGQPEQAEIRLYWPARDDADLAEAMQINLLGRVLRLMLTDELRERLGKTYSPSAGSDLSRNFPGYGHLFTQSAIDYGDLAAAEAAMRSIAAELRAAPPSADLLARARTPLVEQLTNARRENGYWLPYVSRATSEAGRLDRSRGAIAAVEAATPADLFALAQRYLTDDKALVIRAVHPSKVSGQP